jgi:hypothetical protein
MTLRSNLSDEQHFRDDTPRLEENDTQENLQSRWRLKARNDQISTHHCPRLLGNLILFP